MTQAQFKYSVLDLDDAPRIVSEKLSDEFLTALLADTEAEPAGTADGRLELTLSKSGRQVIVHGKLRAQIQVPCARTLDPAIYKIVPDVLLVLSPRPTSAGGAGKQAATEGGFRRSRAQEKAKAAKSQKKSGSGWEEDPFLDAEDAAADFYDGEQIELDSFLREFILLELPMVPLREDLRDANMEATGPLPNGPAAVGKGEQGEESSSDAGEKPIDPRLSPLAELKARLEKKE